MGRQKLDAAVRRVDATRLAVENPWGVPVTLFANDEIPVEAEAVEQLLSFVSLQETLEALDGQFWGGEPGRLAAIVVTPDFHRGSGIPIGTVVDARGFVIPKAVGNDVCCGMRLLVTDLTRGEIEPILDRLAAPLRASFFEGKRDIPMSPRQREALLRDGLPGLHETCGDNARTGIWRSYDPAAQRADLERVHFGGSLPARGIFSFGDYVRGSGAADGRDSHLGSVGGGNHFVEIQTVEDVFDGAAAHAWGLRRGAVAIMAHSGSVGLGHAVRKGACPAPGRALAADGPFSYTGHPVIIPGSMGSSSYVMAGDGSEEALASACHGAGRILSRGKARQVDEEAYERAVSRLRVITPIDPESHTVRGRSDVLEQYHGRLKEEAPYAYKEITPVIETVEAAGIARRVARLWPLLTVKE